ncbi:MAG: MSHA biogenesis protein MshM [Pseudohongiellaceae bacterium]|jgi:MSHA biogenesis protein MshM
MYIKHFGLMQYPFSLTPNTRYFLKLPAHEQAFQKLLLALSDEGQFSKLTGEVGAGKTMLCRKVLNALANHKDKYITAYIPHPYLDEEGVMHALAGELGLLHLEKANYRELLKAISEEILAQSKKSKQVVLFVDEAQAMPVETLAALYLLTNIETAQAHFQVVLFGQPELDLLLDEPALRPLRQCLSFSHILLALNREDADAYIAHRLAKAGYSGQSLFSQAAIDAIFQASGGIPRLINILCHKALMVGYGKGEQTIPIAYAKSAIADTESAHKERGFADRVLGR